MPSAPGGPRLLLRRLREIMAEPVAAQDRLDKIVVLIAANMVAEVCSVYVLRGDGVLELFATEGLNREAVHRTTMRAGEGLVGLIASTAEPLALSDAQSHPSFSYKPETVNVRSVVVVSSETTWMIMSTLMLASARGTKIEAAMPGLSETFRSVIWASSRE